MLLTLSHSPRLMDLVALRRVVTPEDDILLMQDAVVAALKGDTLLESLVSMGAALFVLQADVAARGLTEQICTGVQMVDYNGFVELSVKHHQQMAW